MANSLTSNPIILDTTAASSFAVPVTIRPVKIVWDGPTTAAHTFQLVYGDGTVAFQATCGQTVATGVTIPYDFNQPCLTLPLNGWYLKTLGSGKILIFWR